MDTDEWATGVRRVAVLTGAGISTDSGIPDYRGPDGVWTRNPAASDLFTIDNFLASAEVRAALWRRYLEHAAWRAQPNAAHRALVDLERAGVAVRVLTQNVDGLHQRAGQSPNKVVELHGAMRDTVCTGCAARTRTGAVLDRVRAGEPDPACPDCGGILKPGVVMFGELLDPDRIGLAQQVAGASDLFLAVGSSLRVEPAASLCLVAVECGARLVVVNRDPTPYDALATEVIRDPISQALPRIVAALTSAATPT
jgi:NAD-dependent deacetylase